jgi:hypothetical protein
VAYLIVNDRDELDTSKLGYQSKRFGVSPSFVCEFSMPGSLLVSNFFLVERPRGL